MRVLIGGLLAAFVLSFCSWTVASDQSAISTKCDVVALKAGKIMHGRQAGLSRADIAAQDEKDDPSENGKVVGQQMMNVSAFYGVEKSREAKEAVVSKFADYYKDACLESKAGL